MTTRDDSLHLLFDLWRLGVPEAEDELFRHLDATVRDLVTWTLRRRRLYLAESDVEDVVQDVLFEAWRFDLVRFDPTSGPLTAFLRSRVRWRVADAFRRLGHQAERDAPFDECQESVAQGVHPEELLDRADEEGRLRLIHAATLHSLERLERRDRHAALTVRVHDLAGQPLRLCADRLDIHPSNVTRARQRAFAHLREDLHSTMLMAA